MTTALAHGERFSGAGRASVLVPKRLALLRAHPPALGTRHPNSTRLSPPNASRSERLDALRDLPRLARAIGGSADRGR